MMAAVVCVIFRLFRHWDRATMLSQPQRRIKASPPCAFTCAIVSLLTAIKCSIVLPTSDCLSFGSCLQISCQNKACRHNKIKPTLLTCFYKTTSMSKNCLNSSWGSADQLGRCCSIYDLLTLPFTHLKLLTHLPLPPHHADTHTHTPS